jgi:hypothetical protein
MSRNIWAPEMHFIDGKWYLYFTAGRADAPFDIRLYVLENAAANPLEGQWSERGQTTPAGNRSRWTPPPSPSARSAIWSGPSARPIGQAPDRHLHGKDGWPAVHHRPRRPG